MLDMLIRGATLPDGRTNIDIGIQGGKIAAVGPNLAAEAGEVIDATGRLVTPPFADAHVHMDSTLSLGLPRLNESGMFNPRYLRRIVEDHESGVRDYSSPIWTLLMFEAFLKNVMHEK